MPPKNRDAPKPAEFQLARLVIGRKSWQAGGSGPMVQLSGFGAAAAKPRRQVFLLGKVLFGRERLAFEIQEVDNSPAAVRKMLKKASELQGSRIGCGDTLGPDLGEDSADDVPQQRKGHAIGAFEVFQAAKLAAKYSLQIKFEDISRINIQGDTVTLNLSVAPTCYVKPVAESRAVNMETAKDITGGAKTISFTHSSAAASSCRASKAVSFKVIQNILAERSPRLAALFKGLPPPSPAEPGQPATPKGKRKQVAGDEDGDSSSKQPRHGNFFVRDITSVDGSWLKRAIERFGLRGFLNSDCSELQWKLYFQRRILDELAEAATLRGGTDGNKVVVDAGAGGTFGQASWPEELGPQPVVPQLGFESYRGGSGERKFAADMLEKIRASVKATLASTCLKLDPDVVSRGVFLNSYHINDADEGEPCTVTTSARVYAPNGSGHYVDLEYENHQRVRSSFTERHSYLYARRGDMGLEKLPSLGRAAALNRKGLDKIFELDFNEHRRKNPTKSSVATHAVLAALGAHLFGAEGAMSNRKVFGLLVRAAGLGKFGECNGWPVAVARCRFKCGTDECETDTERIPGDDAEEVTVGDFFGL